MHRLGSDGDVDGSAAVPLCPSLKGLSVDGTEKRTYGFYASGIEVRRKLGGLFSKSTARTVAWDNVRKCNAQWGCFSGVIRLEMAGGGTRVLSAGKSTMKKALAVIQERMAHKQHTIIVLTDSEKEFLHNQKGRTRVHESGLSVYYQRCCFGKSSLVPWGSVVSAELQPGCCGLSAAINIKTMLREEEKPARRPKRSVFTPRTPRTPRDAVSASAAPSNEPATQPAADAPPTTELESNEQVGAAAESNQPAEQPAQAAAEETQPAEQPQPEEFSAASTKSGVSEAIVAPTYISVKVKGKPQHMQETFQVLKKLMSGGKEDEAILGAPEIRWTQITKTGVTLGPSGRRQLFLPWNSMLSADWVTTLLGGTRLTISDSIGDDVVIKKVKEEGYLKFREIMNSMLNEIGEAPTIEPVIKKGIRFQKGGVCVTKRVGCFGKTVRSFPWSTVDAAVLRRSCFGASLDLITVNGVRIPGGRAGCFGVQGLIDLWRVARAMKYGVENEARSPLFFAGKPGRKTTCLLTDMFLRVPGRGAIRLVDLDSVASCQATPGSSGCCGRPGMLDIEIEQPLAAALLGTDETVIHVKLKRGEDAEALSAEIMKRAGNRKTECRGNS